MNKLHARLFFMATLVLWASACSSSDEELNPSTERDGGVLSSHEVALPPIGGEWHMTVTSIVPWHLEIPDDGEWIRFTTQSGKEGTSVVSISADINSVRKDRSLVVRCIADDGSFEERLTVTQPYPYLRVHRNGFPNWEPADTIGFDWNQYERSRLNPGKEQISIESNVDWKIVPENGDANSAVDTTRTHDDVFIGLSVLEGKGNATLDILPYGQNIDTLYQRLSFRIIPVVQDASGQYTNVREKGANGREAIDEFLLHTQQRFLKFLINNSAKDKEYSISELNEELSFSIDSEIPWTVDQTYGDPSWIRFSKLSAASGKSELRISADGANPSRSMRQTSIRLTSEVGAYRIIQLKQRPFVLEVDNDFFAFVNNDTATKSFKVKTTGGIALRNVPNWISYDQSAFNASDST